MLFRPMSPTPAAATSRDGGQRREPTGSQAEPEAPGKVELDEAVSAVAGDLVVCAAVVLVRYGQLVDVAQVAVDDVADDQRQTCQTRQVAAVPRHHVEQDQRQHPKHPRRPADHTQDNCITLHQYLLKQA